MNKNSNNDFLVVEEHNTETASENKTEQVIKTKRMPLWKRVCLVVAYTVLVCAITCGVVFGIQKAHAPYKIIYVNDSAQNNYKTVSNVRKEAKFMEKFDRYVSFGQITSTELMQSYLLSEADKSVINHTVEHFKKELNSDFTGGIFLGEMDGEDYLYIAIDYPLSGYIFNDDDIKHNEAVSRIINCEQCKAIFPNFYKCDLEYSLNDIIRAFEEIIGQTLTRDFLCERNEYFAAHGCEAAGGIQIDFIANDEWYNSAISQSKKNDKYQFAETTTLITKKGDFSDAKIVEDELGNYIVTLDNEYVATASEILSKGKDELVYISKDVRPCYCCEVFYALYNNQLYFVNRAYLLTGQMVYNSNMSGK